MDYNDMFNNNENNNENNNGTNNVSNGYGTSYGEQSGVYEAGYAAQPQPDVIEATPISASCESDARREQAAGKPERKPEQKSAKKPAKKPVQAHGLLYGLLGGLIGCVVALAAMYFFVVPGISAQITSDITAKIEAEEIGSGSGSGSGSGDSQVIITPASEDISLATAVAEKCLPSVAAVDVYEYSSSSWGRGSSKSSTLTETSLGSGVVISANGYILTNHHVIEDADAVKVTVQGVEYDATIVGSDESSDIAVLKIDATGLTPMDIGDSDEIVVGEWVMTLGSPYGLEQSVATGIVSATSRSTTYTSSSSYWGGESTTTYYTNLIQTDAAINPGNSGGALVNAKGELIGINSLLTSNSSSYAGVGFAIPINYAMRLAQQIIAGETPTHAQLGISVATVSSNSARQYDLSVSEGAYVTDVYSDGAAMAAGIQEGDVIIKFNDTKVTSATELILAIRSCDPGDSATVTLVRGSETLTLNVKLGSD